MTKEEILDSAAQIISQKGYHATSMADIAQSVGLQKASLYHHVASKQEILVELLDRALDLLTERLERALAKPMNAPDQLREAMRVYLDALIENHDLASVLLLEHRSLEPQFSARHVPRRDRFEGLWLRILKDGIAAGEFECADPKVAVKIVLGVANWTITWFRPNGRQSPKQIADMSADLLLSGLRVRENES
ncbi:MAG: TetR/AcrR family transcriptional regulator [Anaerolineae bacterium]|nr:MAG: TetR/AcrR family transcriptional regulator [Anaerolineae bacterium]